MLEFCIGVRECDFLDSGYRRRLRGMGISQLSLPSDFIMSPGNTHNELVRLRETLKNDGMCASTSHPPFGSFNEPFSLLRQNPRALAEEIDWMREFILRCGLLGIHAIPLHTGGAMLPRARDWEVQCARSYIRALLPAAEKAGVIIAIENTNHATPVGFYPGVCDDVPLNKNIWEFDDSERILDLVRFFASPFVRICYDTGHSHLLGKVLPDMDRFLPYIALFHIHDNDGAGNDSHIQPGYGNTPWRAIFDRLPQLSGPAPLFVESRPFFGSLDLMMTELNAIAENRVVVKEGGFLLKDEDSGKIVILPKEGMTC